MTPFTTHTGQVAPLKRNNVDTDQIIPKQFLKRIERTGFGQFLFFDWRFDQDGKPNPDFVLNQDPYTKASILLAGENFGCGSSREHAPWALSDFGFRVILAPSFADIFYNNCFQNGILPIALSNDTIKTLFDLAQSHKNLALSVDLEQCTIHGADGQFETAFAIDPERRDKMLKGLDPIGETLQFDQAIKDYERAHATPAVPDPM